MITAQKQLLQNLQIWIKSKLDGEQVRIKLSYTINAKIIFIKIQQQIIGLLVLKNKWYIAW